jgi:sn-glycerol 3-phosphate transport system substrate-binding protein
MKFKRLQCMITMLLACISMPLFAASKRIDIPFWHSLAGGTETALTDIVNQFNQAQSTYVIKPVYKGDYTTSFASLIAAYRANQQPAIAQVYEIGTGTMMSSPSVYVPLEKLMKQYAKPVTVSKFIPAIGYYYANHQGVMQALPFNASSPVLYYNKAAFKKAGLNPSKPPKTWPDVEKDAKALKKAGYACGFTTTWPAWIQFEVFTAWQGVPFANCQNGLACFATKALYNNKALRQHLTALKHWQSQGLFVYGGRGDDAQALFTSGTCPMMTQSSGARGALFKVVGFPLGVGPLPYWPNIKTAPQNTSIGGGALWVMKGQSDATYRGVAAFFTFLLKPQTELQWQKLTGYLPTTIEGYHFAIKKGYYKTHPGSEVAIKTLQNKPTTLNSRGIRLGNFPLIRDENDNALEVLLTTHKSADKVLKNAVKEVDTALMRFKEINE